MSTIETLPAKRLKRKYRQHDLYLILVDKENKLHALQTSVSDRDMNRDAHTLANIEALSRFASLVVRAYGVQFAIKELEGCAMGPHTLPAILAGAIREHCEGEVG